MTHGSKSSKNRMVILRMLLKEKKVVGKINLNTRILHHLNTEVCFGRFICVAKCDLVKNQKDKSGHHGWREENKTLFGICETRPVSLILSAFSDVQWSSSGRRTTKSTWKEMKLQVYEGKIFDFSENKRKKGLARRTLIHI